MRNELLSAVPTQMDELRWSGGHHTDAALPHPRSIIARSCLSSGNAYEHLLDTAGIKNEQIFSRKPGKFNENKLHNRILSKAILLFFSSLPRNRQLEVPLCPFPCRIMSITVPKRCSELLAELRIV